MTSGLVASVQCPACGQFFLCQQQAAEGMVTCPHCAHQGYRAHFPTQGQTASLAPGRRQVFQKPAEMPAGTQPFFEPPPQPPVPAWTGHLHAPAPMMQTPVAAPAPQVWRQPTSTAPTAAMQPAVELRLPPDDGSVPEFVPLHQQGSPVKTFFLGASMVAVLAIGGWIWWDAQNHTPSPNRPLPVASALPDAFPAEPEVRRAAIPTTAETAEAARPTVDVAAVQSEARVLVEKLFQTDDPAERLGTVHDGTRHAAEIEAFFNVPADQRPKLTVLSAVKGTAVSLPQGEVMPLLNLSTSKCSQGALVRLIESTEGQRRIDWPLLRETHEGVLRQNLAVNAEAPSWAWALIKPSHGFELQEKDRPLYLTFSMHVTADGRSPILACAERETPLGRYLDRETDWGQAYLCRVFVRRLPAETSGEAVLIVDCEGAALSQVTPP